MDQASASTSFFNPVSYVLQFLASYGWYLVGALAASLYLARRLRPTLDAWRQAREDAEYHKDPDRTLARMEAIQLARERQQQRLREESQRARALHEEREERKRAEAAERLKKYEESIGGRRLGTPDDEYLPLAGGASSSSYRPPKRSACARGGCGR